MRKIGVFGGTFDPIHQGHLMLAEAARESAGLDLVLFIPSGDSYFKSERAMKVSTKEDRLAMTRLAVAGCEGFAVSTIEVDREGPSYTSVTLTELSKEFPEAELYLIVGADSILEIQRWKDPQVIYEKAQILASVRDGVDTAALKAKIEELSAQGARIQLMPERTIEISSTDIRERAASHRSIRFLVEPAVERYIASRGLYGQNSGDAEVGDAAQGAATHVETGDSASYDASEAEAAEELTPADWDEKRRLSMLRAMQGALKERRYIHTLGVMFTASSLAMRYGVDVKRAEIAGLFHDCAKHLSAEEMEKLIRRGTGSLPRHLAGNRALMHAPAGAVLAREKYGVEDPEILSAIACHTTGKPGMTLLERILFIADYIESGRKEVPHLDQIRAAAFRDLDACVVMILQNTLGYLRETGAEIDPATEETLLYYLSRK